MHPKRQHISRLHLQTHPRRLDNHFEPILVAHRFSSRSVPKLGVTDRTRAGVKRLAFSKALASTVSASRDSPTHDSKMSKARVCGYHTPGRYRRGRPYAETSNSVLVQLIIDSLVKMGREPVQDNDQMLLLCSQTVRRTSPHPSLCFYSICMNGHIRRRAYLDDTEAK